MRLLERRFLRNFRRVERNTFYDPRRTTVCYIHTCIDVYAYIWYERTGNEYKRGKKREENEGKKERKGKKRERERERVGERRKEEEKEEKRNF